jgi:dihydroneopterin aldolase
MTDKIVLSQMEFEAHVGAGDGERAELQVLEVDVELSLDLRAAGAADDLERTVDYGAAFERVREVVTGRQFHLLEGIAEAVAAELLTAFPPLEAVTVRVRKPGVPIDGVLDYAGVEISRSR